MRINPQAETQHLPPALLQSQRTGSPRTETTPFSSGCGSRPLPSPQASTDNASDSSVGSPADHRDGDHLHCFEDTCLAAEATPRRLGAALLAVSAGWCVCESL